MDDTTPAGADPDEDDVTALLYELPPLEAALTVATLAALRPPAAAELSDCLAAYLTEYEVMEWEAQPLEVLLELIVGLLVAFWETAAARTEAGCDLYDDARDLGLDAGCTPDAFEAVALAAAARLSGHHSYVWLRSEGGPPAVARVLLANLSIRLDRLVGPADTDLLGALWLGYRQSVLAEPGYPHFFF